MVKLRTKSRTLLCQWCQETVIRHALNGGEQIVHVDGVAYRPDGYLVIDATYIWEFNGCRFHNCPNPTCTTKNILTESELAYEKLKFERLSRFDNFKVMFECQWKELKSKVSYRNFTSFFYNIKRSLTETELLQAVVNGDLFGLGKLLPFELVS